MKPTGPPRTWWQRAIARAPIRLYRLGLGGLLGGRFVLLEHRGRRSGLPRQVVLEVVDGDPRSGEVLIASGYGSRAQWFRNIRTHPRVGFRIGERRFTGVAEPLEPAESGRRLAAYALRRPRSAALLMRTIGHDVDGTPDAYERLGADAEHGIPLVRLRLDRA
jgi:deazaflavin-dependent oxidoreductase (nitroreductase family)